jgi:hypothetical protein
LKNLPKVVLLLISVLSYSQTQIVDLETKAPVSFATVIFGNGQGLFADDEGIFVFNEKLYPGVDSLTISALGYSTLKIASKKLTNTILLKAEIDELEEVVLTAIVNKPFKKETIKPILDNDYFNCWLPTIESEIAVLFEFNNPQTRKLTSISFPITPESVDWNKRDKPNTEKDEFSTLFKVKCYENRNGQPGKELIKQNLIFIATEKDGNAHELDVSKYNIMIPKNGIFISLQVLGYTDKNGKLLPNKKYKEIKSNNETIYIPTSFRPLLPFTNKIDGHRTFVRRIFIAENNWVLFKKGSGITSSLLDKNLNNYGIGINYNTYKE